MRKLPSFLSYTLVGVLNTLVHWLVFLGLVYSGALPQATANLLAFLCAVTFSFFVNARVTFRSHASPGRYVAYVVFMGGLSYAVGAVGQSISAPPLLTLVLFSAVSLGLGFLFSRYLVFGKPGA